ncbi:MAG: AAA family ATPase [Pseudohongiellaceae bacterium]
MKIRRISISNYKGIEKLELDFPMPRMPDDPDIIALGSKNGVGKTSVMECCTLLLLAATHKEDEFDNMVWDYSINILDLLIKAGSDYATISGDIEIGNGKLQTITMNIHRNEKVKISRKPSKIAISEAAQNSDSDSDLDDDLDDIILAVCGLKPSPVVVNPFLFFHSYRKVEEGNPELGSMVEGDVLPKRNIRHLRRMRHMKRRDSGFDEFKVRILRSMMGQAELFEIQKGAQKAKEDNQASVAIKTLNYLVEIYAGGQINKLRPSADNTIEFRVEPASDDEGDSFSFDGLSSGQKEIISTLFLIWYHTRENPQIVFIDEPELHLNEQWHHSFVNNLVKLAPQNQYIIATHSEDVMDSVEFSRRILLMDSGRKE